VSEHREVEPWEVAADFRPDLADRTFVDETPRRTEAQLRAGMPQPDRVHYLNGRRVHPDWDVVTYTDGPTRFEVEPSNRLWTAWAEDAGWRVVAESGVWTWVRGTSSGVADSYTCDRTGASEPTVPEGLRARIMREREAGRSGRGG
jgi:hypothetical protein